MYYCVCPEMADAIAVVQDAVVMPTVYVLPFSFY
jgi:hypothetical protein